MPVAAILVVVLDAQVGEVDLLVEVGQVVLQRPALNLVVVAIGPAVASAALVQPLLVFALELVVQDHPFDADAALLETLRFAQIGAVDLRVVFHFSRLLEVGVKLLARASIAAIPMRQE